MKKHLKKLSLNRETVRRLSTDALSGVVGGQTEAGCQTDSCITCVKTGCDATNLSGCCPPPNEPVTIVSL